MGFWDDVVNFIEDAGDAVEDFVNDVGDAVANTVEAVGDAINDGLTWIGEQTGFFGPFFSWLGGVFKGIFAIASATIKAVFGIVGGLISGIIKIFGGVLTLHGGLIWQGLGDIVSPIVGSVILIIGKIIAWIQAIFYFQAFERPLTDDEINQLRRVFRDVLNYYVIRIIEGHAGLFGINSRAFVLGNTIYMKRDDFSLGILVHETTHIWQYQQEGNRYASDAIAAQWFVDNPYSWQKEVDERGKTDWRDFNKEAQASFIQKVWSDGELRDANGATLTSGEGSFYDADNEKTFGHFEKDGSDYTAIANRAVETVRTEWF